MKNREFGLDNYTKTELCSLPTADELRQALNAGENSSVRNQINMLFDANTFVEIGAYTTRGFSDFVATEKTNALEGVICGYGAIDGKLAFVFAEDASRMGGAIDSRHAKKVEDLYKLAVKNGAPVIGILNSNGTDVFAGTEGLAAYGRIMSSVASASGVIPQIAFVTGKCIGLSSAIAAMFDFTVKTNDSELYVSSPNLTGAKDAQNNIVAYMDDEAHCVGFIRTLVSFLPMNSDEGISVCGCTDNLNRMLGNIDFGGDALAVVSALADNSVFYPLSSDYATGVVTAFTTIGGIKCGVVATSSSVNEGKIDAQGARKISKFVNFCGSFALPIVTIVDSYGCAIDKENEVSYFAPELAKLSYAYISTNVPKVTVISGGAIGASFVLLGSKALGADVVYATDTSEICALNAQSGVAFAWDQYITLEKTRQELVEEWKNNVSSPARAAASGEIDDIINVDEMRARICSALLMLCAKGQNSLNGIKVMPL